MTASAIRLASGHDTARYAGEFARTGRIHIPGILEEADAQRLHDEMAHRAPWQFSLVKPNADRYVYPHAVYDAFDDAQKRELRDKAHKLARTRFQGHYHTVILSGPERGDLSKAPELAALWDFLEGPEFLGFVRAVTGADDIASVLAQATRYDVGDFLSPHNDRATKASRRAAYVLNLTPEWRAEWGGLLTFLGRDGHVEKAYKPAWNALNLFRVPVMHYVGVVTPIAPCLRYAVSGWLIAGDEA